MTREQKTRGQICFEHAFCTNCPERTSCSIRPLFYSDEQYATYQNKILYYSKEIATSMNFPDVAVSIGLGLGIAMMDQRRKKELELHPTYSAN